MQTPYIRHCKKCDKDFRTANFKAQYHSRCKPKKYVGVRNTAEFEGIKRFIYLRDQFQCCLCSENLLNNDRRRHAHHIDHNPKNNNTRNLITLCNKCHTKTHIEGISYVVDSIEIKKEVFSKGIGPSGKNQFIGIS